MPLALRHRDDPAPAWAPLPALAVRREASAAAMAALQGKGEDEMRRRFAAGHRAYLATWDGQPAAWGWVATRTAEIGELGSVFAIPAGERYLWNFVTLRSHRGLGIYPRLLDAIVRAESAEAERFWVAYAPENHASGSGIRKAGFITVAELSFNAAGRPAVSEWVEGGGPAAARVLGLPVASEPLAPCWRCVRAGRAPMGCAPGSCACDYQVAESGCALAAAVTP
ncbi:MAG TPA: GNAT family N-acetyltransferase [Longimicrobium sp.]|nr:GNAT family N-acetyltransferase [Longimicrobium sp.]